MSDSPTLVVLAAGMGSRYGGLKQLDPVGPSGEVILDYSVYDALQAGFDKVVFVIRKDFEEQFRNDLGKRFESKIAVDYAFQALEDLPDGHTVPAGREKPWGTGHAVLAARDVVDAPFVVINADDFYGRESYATIAEYLRTSANSDKEATCMVGFPLRNTLSEHGTVARGLCQCDDDHYLVSVVETTSIRKVPEGAAYEDESGCAQVLDGTELASMNMWGFQPSFFPLLQSLFGEFLSTQCESPNSEFYIPFAVDQLIQEGRASTRVLRTDSQWFGVTYQEDKPLVVQSLADLVTQGVYPSSLWG